MNSEHRQPEFLRLIFTDLLGHTRSIEVGMNRLEEIVKHGLVPLRVPLGRLRGTSM